MRLRTSRLDFGESSYVGSQLSDEFAGVQNSVGVMAWGVQDFDASFAATEMTTSATLRTVDERDDARVLRAYAQVRASERVRVTFETETNPQQRTRDARLTIVADTEKDARASLTVALVLLAVAIYATLS